MRFYEIKGVYRGDVFTPKPLEVGETGGKKTYLFEDGSEVTDTTRKLESGIIEVTRAWKIKGKGKIRLFFEWETDKRFDDWFVPSVIYRENRDGEGYFPRGGIDYGWEFREDRMGIPGAVFLTSPDKVVGIFTEPATDTRNISSSTVMSDESGHILSITIPFTEAPKRYIAKGFLGLAYGRAKRTWFKSDGEFSYQRRFYIYETKVIDYYSVFKTAVEMFGREGEGEGATIFDEDIDEQIEIRKRHIVDYLYYDNGKMTNSCLAGIRRGAKNTPIIQWFIYDVIGGGFLEKGIQGAYLLNRLGEGEKAKKIADFLLKGQMENGLAWVCYHIRKKKWGGAFLAFPKYLNEKITLRPLGEMGYFYLKLYNDTKNEAYFDYARRVGDFFLENQKADGNYGRLMETDGSLFDDRGTNGAYIAIMMIELYKCTGDNRYLISAMKSVDYFIKKVVIEGEYLADALDSDCIDKEGGAIIVKLLIHAFDVTNQKRLLDSAHSVANHVLSWVWSYDCAFDEDTPLGKEKFSTFAMTSVSVAHHHLDFYGAEIAVDLLKLDHYSGEDRYGYIALPMISCSSQILNGYRGHRNHLRPEMVGWQPEEINHTDWNMMHPLFFGGKGTYQVDIAWSHILTLGALMELKEMIREGKLRE